MLIHSLPFMEHKGSILGLEKPMDPIMELADESNKQTPGLFPQASPEYYPSTYTYVSQVASSFFSGFATISLYAFLIAPTHTHTTCPCHMIFTDLITQIIYSKGYKF
jgi:hypothetical protein